MTGIDVPRPHFTGFHHFSITVTDVEQASTGISRFWGCSRADAVPPPRLGGIRLRDPVARTWRVLGHRHAPP